MKWPALSQAGTQPLDSDPGGENKGFELDVMKFLMPANGFYSKQSVFGLGCSESAC